jgi:membrane protease subunit HflK
MGGQEQNGRERLMAGSGGPWGGGSGNNDDDDRGKRDGGRGGRRPGEGGQIPEIEEIVKKGTEQLKVLIGGRGARGGNGGGFGGGQGGPHLSRNSIGLGVLAAIGLWAFASFYTVQPEESRSNSFLASAPRW